MSLGSNKYFRVKKPKFIDTSPSRDKVITRPKIDEKEVEELVKNLDGRIRKVVQKQRRKVRREKQMFRKWKESSGETSPKQKVVRRKKKRKLKRNRKKRKKKGNPVKRKKFLDRSKTSPTSNPSKNEIEKEELPDMKKYQSARMFKEYLYRTHCKIPRFLKDVRVNRTYIDRTKKSGPTGNFSIPSVLLKTTYPKDRILQRKLRMTLDNQDRPEAARKSELDVKRWKRR